MLIDMLMTLEDKHRIHLIIDFLNNLESNRLRSQINIDLMFLTLLIIKNKIVPISDIVTL